MEMQNVEYDTGYDLVELPVTNIDQPAVVEEFNQEFQSGVLEDLKERILGRDLNIEKPVAVEEPKPEEKSDSYDDDDLEPWKKGLLTIKVKEYSLSVTDGLYDVIENTRNNESVNNSEIQEEDEEAGKDQDQKEDEESTN